MTKKEFNIIALMVFVIVVLASIGFQSFYVFLALSAYFVIAVGVLSNVVKGEREMNV